MTFSELDKNAPVKRAALKDLPGYMGHAQCWVFVKLVHSYVLRSTVENIADSLHFCETQEIQLLSLFNIILSGFFPLTSTRSELMSPL